jgi:hypothetical protein
MKQRHSGDRYVLWYGVLQNVEAQRSQGQSPPSPPQRARREIRDLGMDIHLLASELPDAQAAILYHSLNDSKVCLPLRSITTLWYTLCTLLDVNNPTERRSSKERLDAFMRYRIIMAFFAFIRFFCVI